MNKRTKIILAAMCVLVIIGIVLTVILCKDKEEKHACEDILGGGYLLVYNTNGGNAIESASVCIACGPNSYELLPVPTKEGYIFDGWYYDEELTNMFTGETTGDVAPTPIRSKAGCVTGYDTVILYAKWR